MRRRGAKLVGVESDSVREIGDMLLFLDATPDFLFHDVLEHFQGPFDFADVFLEAFFASFVKLPALIVAQ